SSYAGAAVVFKDPANTQGHQNQWFWVDNVIVRLPLGVGTAFRVDAREKYVQYVRAGALTVERGSVAFELIGGSFSNFCNGNEVDALVVMETTTALRLEKAHGNLVRGLLRQPKMSIPTQPAGIVLVG